MEKLIGNDLFKDLSLNEIEEVIKKCNARIVKYKKNETIITPKEVIDSFGIILSGSVMGVHDDYWGNRTILTILEKNEMFGEAFSFSKLDNLGVSVICASDSEVLFIKLKDFLGVENLKVIQNMMMILASKNVYLTRKMDYMSKRSIKSKLLTYLSDEAMKNKSNRFKIPFNRQELADYLGVDRSAMSNELGKLRDSGVIKFNKNFFELL